MVSGVLSPMMASNLSFSLVFLAYHDCDGTRDQPWLLNTSVMSLKYVLLYVFYTLHLLHTLVCFKIGHDECLKSP